MAAASPPRSSSASAGPARAMVARPLPSTGRRPQRAGASAAPRGRPPRRRATRPSTRRGCRRPVPLPPAAGAGMAAASRSRSSSASAGPARAMVARPLPSTGRRPQRAGASAAPRGRPPRRRATRPSTRRGCRGPVPLPPAADAGMAAASPPRSSSASAGPARAMVARPLPSTGRRPQRAGASAAPRWRPPSTCATRPSTRRGCRGRERRRSGRPVKWQIPRLSVRPDGRARDPGGPPFHGRHRLSTAFTFS